MKTKIIEKNKKKYLEVTYTKEYDLEYDLDLENTPITSLPEGLSVGGSLDLENTPITSLPEGLSVGGSLFLRNTLIIKKSQVPKHLHKKVIGVDLK